MPPSMVAGAEGALKKKHPAGPFFFLKKSHSAGPSLTEADLGDRATGQVLLPAVNGGGGMGRCF